MFTKLLVMSMTVVSCANPKYSQSAETGEMGVQGREVCQARFSTGHCVSITWEKKPTESQYGSFIFKTFRTNKADGSPVVEDAFENVSVVLVMPGMTHPNAPVNVRKTDTGTYHATVFFGMRGVWEIHFQNKQGNEVRDQAVVSLTF